MVVWALWTHIALRSLDVRMAAIVAQAVVTDNRLGINGWHVISRLYQATLMSRGTAKHVSVDCTIYIYIYTSAYTAYILIISVFRGPCGDAPPLGKSEKVFWRDTLLKMGFQTYIFCSKVPSKCRKCRFRDPNFCGPCPRTALQLCWHYSLPLTKILATPLNIMYSYYVQYIL